MKKHESRCTLNPNRECGVHKMMEWGTPPKVSEMVALLPDESKYHQSWDGAPVKSFFLSSQLGPDVDKAMPALKTLSDSCPACMMAAFRQAKIPFSFSGLDFKKEMDEVWNDFWAEKNAEYQESCGGAYA